MFDTQIWVCHCMPMAIFCSCKEGGWGWGRGGGGTNKSALCQQLTRCDRKTASHPGVPSGARTQGIWILTIVTSWSVILLILLVTELCQSCYLDHRLCPACQFTLELLNLKASRLESLQSIVCGACAVGINSFYPKHKLTCPTVSVTLQSLFWRGRDMLTQPETVTPVGPKSSF